MPELAKISGVHSSTIWRIENGAIASATLSTLVNLAIALKCEITDLYEVSE
jgi:transcriptional regulator with XRE-family HTH domain